MGIVTYSFERKKNQKLYQQIANHIIDDIEKEHLKQGDRLPSIREAAKMMDVSKTSVENAYNRLLEDGYIIAKAGRGYFVDVSHVELKNREFIMKADPIVESPYRYNLSSNAIDMESFDFAIWKHYIKAVMEEKEVLSQYGDTQGELRLRKALQRYAYTQRGVVAKVENIIVGASYQSLLYLLCSLLKKPITIAMEEDGFLQAMQVFEDMHYPLCQLPRKNRSIALQELEQSQANLFYFNSSACGKYRSQVDRENRKKLLSWCEKENHYLIEDDHNGELRYASKVYPAIQGFDTKGKVIYIGSFSKILLPSLRIAYMVLPDQLSQIYHQKKGNYSPTASKVEQLALANYIAEGNLDRHIKRVRKRYERKSRYMYFLLKQYFPKDSIYLEETSFQYVVEFKEKKCNNIKEEIRKAGILMDINEKRMKISFSMISELQMEEIISFLAMKRNQEVYYEDK